MPPESLRISILELFAVEEQPTDLPELEYGQYEDALDEMKILGFPYTNHLYYSQEKI